MSKEAARVSKVIKLNNQTTFVTKVVVNNVKEITSCIEKIHNSCPDTIVLITCAIIKTNTLLAASAFPDGKQLNNFLADSIASVIEGEPIFTDGTTPACRVVEIVYPAESEQYAFKNVDTVNGTAFSLLKKAGLYEEPEDSSECELPDL